MLTDHVYIFYRPFRCFLHASYHMGLVSMLLCILCQMSSAPFYTHKHSSSRPYSHSMRSPVPPFHLFPLHTRLTHTTAHISSFTLTRLLFRFPAYCACAVLPVMRNTLYRTPTPACLSDRSWHATSRTHIAPLQVTTIYLAPSLPERVYRLHYSYQRLPYCRI